MERDKLSAIAFIAIILSAVGAGVGIFAAGVILTGGADGDDGDDGDDGAAGTTTTITITVGEYPCASETEINNALTAIGTGYGKIMITDNITLSASIDIDGGGSYIIEGVGLPTVESGGDYEVFRITDAASCIIRDLLIDGSTITSGYSIIYIDEIIDNPISIDNVGISSTPSSDGIFVDSNNVTVRNCFIMDVSTAIYIETAENTKIYDNEILYCDDNGIQLFSGADNNVIYNNYIHCEGGNIGIYLSGSDDNVISYNIIKNFNIYGVTVTSACRYNEIIGNHISDSVSTITSINRTCIHITGDYNDAIDNNCFNCKNPSPSYYGNGIYLTSIAGNNIIVGNNCIDNDNNICNLGTGNTLYGNNAP